MFEKHNGITSDVYCIFKSWTLGSTKLRESCPWKTGVGGGGAQKLGSGYAMPGPRACLWHSLAMGPQESTSPLCAPFLYPHKAFTDWKEITLTKYLTHAWYMEWPNPLKLTYYVFLEEALRDGLGFYQFLEWEAEINSRATRRGQKSSKSHHENGRGN